MSPIEKFFAILSLLLLVAWLVAWTVDEELESRKRDKE